jgi:putative ABC transport system permease protein
MSDAVRQKKREIALRLALGAQGWTIVYQVFRGGVRVAALGAAAGLIVSWTLVRLVLHANPGFVAPALWMWLAAPAALLMVVALASVLPARWALAVDPLTITRES